MEYFFDSIFRVYLTQKYKYFCEIGVAKGENTDRLLQMHPLKHVIIDPCIDCDLIGKYKNNDNVTVCKGISLQVLPKISEPFDCIFIDGDHNWYTVYNELKIINEKKLLNPGGTIFLHDVGWPYGRRDMYYLPETIPEHFRHPYERKGIIRGKSELVDTGGKYPDLFNAKFEGGARNGVLTAVEDFMKEFGHEYIFFHHKVQSGLGFLIRREGFLTELHFIKWLIICHLLRLIKLIKLDKCMHYFLHPREISAMIKRKLNRVIKL